jgi:hypothetical protein
VRSERISGDFPAITRYPAGAGLALKAPGHPVFRAALFSIVLTLVAGPNTGLLCQAWCHPHDASSAGCEHQDSATFPSVGGDDHCTAVAVGAVAFVREDDRAGSVPDTHNADIVPGLHLTSLPRVWGSGYESKAQLLPERPRVIALRI